MKVLSFALLALFTLSLIGCSSVTVKSDFDPEYDFKAFKTYRWATPGELNPNDELAKNPLILKRVQDAVDKELAAKGLNVVESEEFDLVVIAHAGLKERTQVTQTGGGGYYGGHRGWYDPYWGPYGGSTHVSTYEEGTLVIDMVVWETKEMAWRGMGTKILNDTSDPDKVTEIVNAWVAKILAEYPPK
jgi:hypothetical protein